MNGQVVYGQALFEVGKYEQAEATFTTALSLDPENLIALRHLGDIARLNGNVGGAMDWYKRVLDADPRNDEIIGFIEELKAAAAAPPPREPTPVATPVVTSLTAPVVAEAPHGAPTPVVPLPPVEPRRSVPVNRPSVGLIDLDISMATDAAAAADAPPPAMEAPPAAPAEVPSGDIALGNLDFGEVSAAPAAGYEAGEFVPPTTDTIPAAEGLESTDSLGWDMGDTVNLDAPAAPIEEPGSGPRPQVFVTETMAELYLQQGFRDEALKVYKQLAEQNPDDMSLRERVAALESGGRASMSFETLAVEEPEYAPGTDALVPMPEPTAADALDVLVDAPMPVAEIPEIPVESLDFDMSTTIPSPDGSIPEQPVVANTMGFESMDLGTDPTPAPVTARAFFGMLAQRKALRPDGTLPQGMDAVAAPVPARVADGGSGLDALFSTVPSEADDGMGLALMTAVASGESSAQIRGRPTQEAGSELSLDSVFRSESHMRSSGPVKRQSQLLKFDQFFSAEAPAGEPTDTPAASDPGPAVPADDAQFQAWLTQLKNQ